MFSDYNVGISNLAINLRVFSIAVSYMWAYIIANNIAGKFKVRNFLLMLVSYILGIFNSVILGARGEAIQLIIAFVVFYMVFQRKYNNWKVNIKFKHIVLMLAIVAGILITFKASGDILGRNTDYLENKAEFDAMADKVVYTGAIDAYFDYKLGTLEYRSVRFETETLDKPNFQGNAAVNYTDRETPWTRIIEHKWFEFGKDEQGNDLPKTVISREFSSEWKPGDNRSHRKFLPVLRLLW